MVNDSGVPLSNVTKVSAGSFHGLAVKDDGSVWSWGTNYDGELGNGATREERPYASQVLDISGQPLDNVRDVITVTRTFNGQYNFAFKEDNTVWVWGNVKNLVVGDKSVGTQPRAIQLEQFTFKSFSIR